MGEIQFFDMDSLGENVFVIKEHYRIPDVWKPSSGDSSLMELFLYPLNLESLVSFPSTPERTSPYYSGHEDYKHHIVARLPESWNVENVDLVIDGNGYFYSSSVLYDPEEFVLYITYDYSRSRKYLEPSEAAKFVSDHERIMDDLGFTLNYDLDVVSSSGSGWLGWILTLFILGILVFAMFKLYVTYDPEPMSDLRKYTSIGGWMFLPMIGLILTPLRVMYEYQDAGFLDGYIWNNLDALGGGFTMVLIYEMIYNLALVVSSVFLLTLFFKCRTSFPNLYSIYLISQIFLLPFDWLLVDIFVDGTEGIASEDTTDLGRSIIGVLIWVPYFKFSARSKETFHTRLREGAEPEEPSKENETL